MDEKRCICKCSNTPEVRKFMKCQAHVHCPCAKCGDRAVMQWLHGVTCKNDENGDSADLDKVATSLEPETSNSSDCASVSN